MIPKLLFLLSVLLISVAHLMAQQTAVELPEQGFGSVHNQEMQDGSVLIECSHGGSETRSVTYLRRNEGDPLLVGYTFNTSDSTILEMKYTWDLLQDNTEDGLDDLVNLAQQYVYLVEYLSIDYGEAETYGSLDSLETRLVDSSVSRVDIWQGNDPKVDGFLAIAFEDSDSPVRSLKSARFQVKLKRKEESKNSLDAAARDQMLSRSYLAIEYLANKKSKKLLSLLREDAQLNTSRKDLKAIYKVIPANVKEFRPYATAQMLDLGSGEYSHEFKFKHPSEPNVPRETLDFKFDTDFRLISISPKILRGSRKLD